MDSNEIIRFWFEECLPENWFSVDEKFDELIRHRFTQVYRQAAKGELFRWRESAEGALAEVIILDQFPRNMFRGRPEAFATDSLALVLAQNAVGRGSAQQLETKKRAFLYMPYMHSESKVIHEEAMKLFAEPGLEYNLDYEIKHKVIIDRFGRYPHRNKILGRESTPEETDFLKGPNSSF